MFDPHFPDKLYSVHATGSQAWLHFLYSFICQALEHKGVSEFVICLISMNACICSLIYKPLLLCRFWLCLACHQCVNFRISLVFKLNQYHHFTLHFVTFYSNLEKLSAWWQEYMCVRLLIFLRNRAKM